MTIEEIMPHRKPFLFVDEITHANEETIVGTYQFKEDEFFFAGHFPDYPVVPGVLLVELMAQMGGAGLGVAGILPPKSPFFLGTVEKAKFRSQVRPNDVATVEITNLRISSRMVRQSGKVFVNGQLCAEATWMCLIAKKAS